MAADRSAASDQALAACTGHMWQKYITLSVKHAPYMANTVTNHIASVSESLLPLASATLPQHPTCSKKDACLWTTQALDGAGRCAFMSISASCECIRA